MQGGLLCTEGQLGHCEEDEWGPSVLPGPPARPVFSHGAPSPSPSLSALARGLHMGRSDVDDSGLPFPVFCLSQFPQYDRLLGQLGK